MNKEQLKKLQLLRQKRANREYGWIDPLGPEFANAILTGEMADLTSRLRGQSYGQGANAKAYLVSAVSSLSQALGPNTSQKIPFPGPDGEIVQRTLLQVQGLVNSQERW